MIVFNVSQLLEMSPDSTPEAFTGRITKVMAVKSGTNTKGNPYSLQRLEVTDGSKTIEVMFDGRDELSRSYEGSEIHCVATRGQRGLTGLKRKDNEFKGKVTPQVWVNDSAEVSIAGSAQPSGPSAPQQQNPPSQQQRQAPPSQQRQPAPQPTNGNGHANGNGATYGNGSDTMTVIKQYNVALAKNCSALNRCFDAAVALADGVVSRHPNIGRPSFSDIKEIAAALMIQTGWSNKAHDIPGFPVREFSTYAPTNGANGHSTPPPQPQQQPQRQGAPFA